MLGLGYVDIRPLRYWSIWSEETRVAWHFGAETHGMIQEKTHCVFSTTAAAAPLLINATYCYAIHVLPLMCMCAYVQACACVCVCVCCPYTLTEVVLIIRCIIIQTFGRSIKLLELHQTQYVPRVSLFSQPSHCHHELPYVTIFPSFPATLKIHVFCSDNNLTPFCATLWDHLFVPIIWVFLWMYQCVFHVA